MKVKTSFKVNGRLVELDLEPRRLLVSVLREDLGLTGTHHACDTTNCGACTILVDGKAVKSCTMLGVQADGKEILTIEGSQKMGTCILCRKHLSKSKGCNAVFALQG